MLNKCIFMGRLTSDPEIRYTQGAEPVAIARFSIAVDRDFKRNGEKVTDFIPVEAWRQRAEFAEKYLTKGQLICVEGSMEQNDWEDKNGNKRRDYRINAANIYFAEGKKQNGESNGKNSNSGSFPDAPNGFDPFAGGGMGFSVEDDDLPM